MRHPPQPPRPNRSLPAGCHNQRRWASTAASAACSRVSATMNATASPTCFTTSRAEDRIWWDVDLDPRRHEDARQQPILADVIAGEDQLDAGMPARGRNVNNAKPGVNMGRPQHHRLQGTRWSNIRHIVACAAHQRLIFLSTDRTAYAEFQRWKHFIHAEIFQLWVLGSGPGGHPQGGTRTSHLQELGTVAKQVASSPRSGSAPWSARLPTSSPAHPTPYLPQSRRS